MFVVKRGAIPPESPTPGSQIQFTNSEGKPRTCEIQDLFLLLADSSTPQPPELNSIWIVRNANFIAESGKKYLVIDNTNRIDITFPANPEIGDSIEFINAFATNGFRTSTLNRYNGFVTRVSYVLKEKIVFVYSGVNTGWVSDKTNAQAIMVDVLWTPLNIPIANRLQWFDADDATTVFDAVNGGNLVAPGGTIARWEDKSGNNRHFTQATVNARPQLQANQVNDRRIVFLNSTSHGMVSEFNITRNYAIYFMARQFSGGARLIQNRESNVVVSINRGSFCVFLDGNVRNLNWGNVNNYDQGGLLVSTTASTQFWGNGVNITDANPSSSNFGRLALGFSGNNSEPANANLCELIVTNDLSVATRERIEGYLAHKWGQQSRLPANHPFRNNAPTL